MFCFTLLIVLLAKVFVHFGDGEEARFSITPELTALELEADPFVDASTQPQLSIPLPIKRNDADELPPHPDSEAFW